VTRHVSVIIPNWNGAKWLPDCLDSLKGQGYRDFETIVVDNGSVDGSVELLARQYPWVKVVENATNLGFAGGMNAGFAAAQGELLVALNNDTEVAPDWLQLLVDAMAQAPEAGSAASQLMDFHDRDVIDSLGDGFLPIGLSFKIGAGRRLSEQRLRPRLVQSPCAAAAVYRRAMLAEIGLYDEDFFAYMEDIDLGLRAQMAGYSCISVPEAKVFHMGSATSGGSASAFSLRQTICNSYQVILKNVPVLLLPFYLVLTLISHVFIIIFSFLPGRMQFVARHRNACLQGLVCAAKLAPNSLRKRRDFKRIRRVGLRGFLSVTLGSFRAHYLGRSGKK